MSCSISRDGTLQAEVTRARPGLEYVAISHVWSGGLGNPSKNGLPECHFFRMDTFCIPVGDTFSGARDKAINLMAEIYGGARAVLVLDPELQRISVTKMEAEQVVAPSLLSLDVKMLDSARGQSFEFLAR